MAIDISDPRYDDYSPDEPDQCEACGVYLDDEDAVIVTELQDGELVTLCVCRTCAEEPRP